MSSIGDLTRQHTALSRAEVAHLKQLLLECGLLSDLCFADLMLYVPADDGAWMVVGQVRPATGQTIYVTDYVGVTADDDRPLLSAAYDQGEICEDAIVISSLAEPARMMAIPVRYDGRPIAVLTREWSSRSGRLSGELERTYLGIFQRFAAMIAEGSFPFHGLVGDSSAAPRVGDGVMVLDDEARVRYASPNAVSALHRVGISANAVGMRLAELGFNDSPVRRAYDTMAPIIEEFDQTEDVTLLTRCMPILSGTPGHSVVTGGVLLLRDVTEVRKRDRLLLSKDATIREIHHRVKNNLQTISSLLRLQGRRTDSPAARYAIEESVRRIRSIALVHETLSHAAGDDVPFLEIVRPLVRMVEEGLISPEHPIRFVVRGDAGTLPAATATAMAVVLTELLQNVVDHAYPDGPDDGAEVSVELVNDGERLDVIVADDGVGPPEGFTVEASTGLGLSIVRTLVTTELAGTIEFRRGEGPDDRPGTVVHLSVPVHV